MRNPFGWLQVRTNSDVRDEDSTQIRILEIYASEGACQSHIKTEHFQKYKQGTLHMVKDLKRSAMKPLDPMTKKLIFKKQR